MLGHEGIPIVALDHDFTRAKITPSVSLVIDIPSSHTETFYRGKVYTHVKNSVFFFSPSSPLVHCCELEDILAASCSGGIIPPIIALYTDGGPDHWPTYGSVQLVCAMSACVNDDELDCLFSFAKLIDPDVSRDMTAETELSGHKKYQEFLGTHAIAHHYCFQIEKCGSSTCKYCSPPRCPPAVFQGLSFLPDPLLDSSGSHFKPFDDIYGKVPNSEKDRPSAGTLLERIDKENKDILVSTKARMIVICCQCNKPRVVYSPLRLQPEVERYVHNLADNIPVDPLSTMNYQKAGHWR